jgi:2-methylcitrate dehydratase
MVHALSLAAVSNNALRQTRTGEISLWKASAFANAARNGIFAAALARSGMTGPPQVFEGDKGFFNAVSGPISLPQLGGEEGVLFKIPDCFIKHYPVEYHAQSAVEAALALYPTIRQEGKASAVVRSIEVKTSAVSREIIGRDPEKWNPRTRETADHSLPYCVSAALQYGAVGLPQFDESHLQDRALRVLIKRTTVTEDPELTALYPKRIGNAIEVTTRSGKYVKRVDFPKGHPNNPMSDLEIEEKFKTLCEGRIPTRRVNRILASIWSLERIADIRKWTAELGKWSG